MSKLLRTGLFVNTSRVGVSFFQLGDLSGTEKERNRFFGTRQSNLYFSITFKTAVSKSAACE